MSYVLSSKKAQEAQFPTAVKAIDPSSAGLA